MRGGRSCIWESDGGNIRIWAVISVSMGMAHGVYFLRVYHYFFFFLLFSICVFTVSFSPDLLLSGSECSALPELSLVPTCYAFLLCGWDDGWDAIFL